MPMFALSKRSRTMCTDIFCAKFSTNCSVLDVELGGSARAIYKTTQIATLHPGLKLMRITDSFIRLASIVSITAPLALAACSSGSSDNAPKGDPAAGKTAVTKYACQSCHTQDLSGTVTPYGTSKAYPANLTPDTDTGLGEWDEATIKTAILTGKDDEGKALCSVMPTFSQANMTDVEATDITAYLKSLPAVKKAIPESQCSAGAAGSGSVGTVGK
jgi:mono/diheme cytochrome c family protein